MDPAHVKATGDKEINPFLLIYDIFATREVIILFYYTNEKCTMVIYVIRRKLLEST